MKIYLDDERPAPEGWLLCTTPAEVISYLLSGDVTDLSLDHDLGLNDYQTGYTVLLWLEEQVMSFGFKPPQNIIIHTANSGVRRKMEMARDAIYFLAKLHT